MIYMEYDDFLKLQNNLKILKENHYNEKIINQLEILVDKIRKNNEGQKDGTD